MRNSKYFPTKFVGLHSHSGFSTYDGLGYPQEHIDYVLENGMDAWALTDHGHMNGFAHAYLHYLKMKKSGKNFKFIPGCEMYIHPNLEDWKKQLSQSKEKKSLVDESIISPIIRTTDENDETVDVEKEDVSLTIENEEETKSSKHFDPLKRRHHLVVLPKTSIGLERLFHLVSRGYLEGFYRFPRVDYKMLKEASSGGHLIVKTACLTADAELITDKGNETLLSVVTRFNNGEHVEVLSYNETSKIKEFKKVSFGALTRKNAKLVKINLKNGKSVTLTPDHKVYTNFGWIEAKDIKSKKDVKILTF